MADEAQDLAQPHYVIRQVTADDLPLVYDSWKRQVVLLDGESLSHRVPRPILESELHGMIDALLCRPGTMVRVACSSDDPKLIFGWACVELRPDQHGVMYVVHFVWVKKPFRRFGIARALLPDLGQQWAYTQRTTGSMEVERAGKIRGAIYVPYWRFR